MAAKEINPQKSSESPLKDAWENIKNIIVDLSTIDITTMQGDVTIDLTGDNVFIPSEVFKNLKGHLNNGSTLTLVAHTHVDFDLDSVMITKPGAATDMLEAHNQAVKTAIEARQAVVKLVEDLFS